MPNRLFRVVNRRRDGLWVAAPDEAGAKLITAQWGFGKPDKLTARDITETLTGDGISEIIEGGKAGPIGIRMETLTIEQAIARVASHETAKRLPKWVFLEEDK